MRSFNGDFTPWRCSGRQRRGGEERHHPLGNKPRKKGRERNDGYLGLNPGYGIRDVFLSFIKVFLLL